MIGGPVSRRDAIGFGLVSIAALTAGVWRGRRSPADEARVPEVAERLADLLTDRSAAAGLGEAWLARQPRRPTIERLVRDISPESHPEAMAATSMDDLRSLVTTALRDDYSAGRIVAVRGWVLSMTEVRLCAITALV